MRKLTIIAALFTIGLLTYGFTYFNSPSKSYQEAGNVTGTRRYNMAPELKFKDPQGKEIALSSLRGNIVLIDFWASWCGPCRMENPNVVATYNKYKNAKFKGAKGGFTIYSVSLDQDKVRWENAIQKDGLTWPYHVSDLKGWGSEAAAIYGVNSIPAGFLIDAKGMIVAAGQEIRGEGLEMALKKLMAN